MKNQDILSQIAAFCRHADMAESTFGRRAVNDGKLVQRLREGKRITIDTLNRIQAYIAASSPDGMAPARPQQGPHAQRAGPAPPPRDAAQKKPPPPRIIFLFLETRKKYLLFVHTCSEK